MATLGVTKKIGSKPAPKAGARVEIAEKSASNASGANPQISPLTPKSFANLPPLAGVRLATGQAGDVILCHPFLVHAASWPHTGRHPRGHGPARRGPA